MFLWFAILKQDNSDYRETKLLFVSSLTPTQDYVESYGRGVGEDCEEYQIVKVEPLHEYPSVVRHHEVLPQAYNHLTLPVNLNIRRSYIITSLSSVKRS